jgi:hypothetical protein
MLKPAKKPTVKPKNSRLTSVITSTLTYPFKNDARSKIPAAVAKAAAINTIF